MYNYGSSALIPQKVEENKRKRKSKANKVKRNRKQTLYTLFLVFIITLLLLVYVNIQADIIVNQLRVEKLSKEVQSLKETNSSLENKIESIACKDIKREVYSENQIIYYSIDKEDTMEVFRGDN